MEADEALSAPMSRVFEDWTDFDVAAFALGRHLGIFPEAGGYEEFRKVKGVFWSNDPLGQTLADALGMMRSVDLLEFRDDGDVGYEAYRWAGGKAPVALREGWIGAVTPAVAVQRLVGLWQTRRAARTSGGVELTEEVLDRAAEEAEAGYDLDRVRPRGSRPISEEKLAEEDAELGVLLGEMLRRTD